jgi:hypothetical protein
MRKNKIENQFTLDAKHKELITTFKNEYSNLNSKKDKLNKLQKKINDINTKSDIDYTELYELENEVEELKEEIAKLESNVPEQNYYLRTNNILYDYYSFNNRIENEHSTEKLHSTDKNIQSESLPIQPTISESIKKTATLDRFFKKSNTISPSTTDSPEENNIKQKDTTDGTDNKKKTKISHFYQVDSKFNKSDILTQYLSIVEPSSVPYTIANQTTISCSDCGASLEININDGNMECISCGTTLDYFYTNDKPTYKDNVPEVNYFSYKPLNHYNESTLVMSH